MMEVIFHEKQEGSLCAQHCLNALLQGPYFSPVELASLAQQMDDEERKRMAESGVDSDDYRKFLEQPSGNMDDSGYFSVQVISSALEVWGLELVPYSSSEQVALMAQKCPTDMQAYICNYRDHWFTIRRLGNQWFNLNSMLTGPELLSNTYLAMFLAQLQQEGYSIFVVNGVLPESDADNLLRVCPAVQTVKPQLLSKPSKTPNTSSNSKSSSATTVFGGVGNVLGGGSTSLSQSDKESFQRHRSETTSKLESTLLCDEEDDDEELQRALLASRAEVDGPVAESQPRVVLKSEVSVEDDQQLREALRLSLEVQNESPEPVSRLQNETPDDEGDEELQKALQMSLECCSGSQGEPQVNAEEIRERRLAFLENAVPNLGASSSATAHSSQINNPTR
ncbi:ataxin-3-like isoform X1 [Ischnura elegans]|uniref:ataxin-3-like isoform X1 n=1 Tax=Ischnura elegans TaxID=197161 RepID=UPI001ED89A10|nr:ataxin-3-like isoform X1 [Ischnura elegans]